MSVDRIPLRKRIALDLFGLKRAIDTRVHELRYLFWECTLRCNLNCVHCGSDCLRDASAPDMPLADFLRVVDGIRPHVAPRKTMIAITGGEPLVREDLEECGRELYKREFPWGFVTNGFALHKDRYARLLDAGLRSITISLDGLEASHDWFRGGKGSFKKAVKAIEMVAKTDNLMYDIVTCAHGRDFDELDRIKKLLIDLGVKRWRLFTVFAKGRAAQNPEVALTDEQFLSLFEFIEATRTEGRIMANYGCEGFLGDMEGRVRNNFFFCMAGIVIGSVLVDGSISACPSLRADYIQGNIYRDDFHDVWERRFRIMRDRRWTKQGECATCTVYRWCGGNGLHLREEKTGHLMLCHYKRLQDAQRAREERKQAETI